MRLNSLLRFFPTKPFAFSAVALIGVLLGSCQHDPLEIGDNGGNTNPPDTTIVFPPDTSDACDPDVVYFELDVLPILQSNCAFSGCHDAASAKDGVVLNTYQNVMNTGEVKPFNLGDSELYEVITDSDPDDRMPPPPSLPLTPEQVSVIAEWILQGAQNLTCNPNAGGCDTTDISYTVDVKPIMQSKCNGCHSGNFPSAGLDLTSYSSMANIALNGQLYGVIAHLPGYSPMPQSGNKLPDCEIAQIRSWINQGAPNN